MLAALSSKNGIAEILLKAGADPNALSDAKLSVLSHAAIGSFIKRDTTTLSYLSSHGMKTDEEAIAAIRSPLLRYDQTTVSPHFLGL